MKEEMWSSNSEVDNGNHVITSYCYYIFFYDDKKDFLKSDFTFCELKVSLQCCHWIYLLVRNHANRF